MSLGKDRPIVQDAESFSKLASELSKSTTIIHVSPEEVNAYTGNLTHLANQFQSMASLKCML